MYRVNVAQVGIGLAIVCVVVFVAGIAPNAQAFTYDGTMTIDCEGFVADDASAWLDRDNTGDEQEHFQLIAVDGAGTVIWFQDSTANLGERVNGIGTGVWQTPPEYNPITFQAISMAGNELAQEIGFEAEGICPGLPYLDPEPGCDVLMYIPDMAVGGTMLVDTAAYWKPGAVTPHILKAGTSLLVLGFDATGQYYKVLFVCDYLWVPVGTVGPNPDAPWNGAALPTGLAD